MAHTLECTAAQLRALASSTALDPWGWAWHPASMGDPRHGRADIVRAPHVQPRFARRAAAALAMLTAAAGSTRSRCCSIPGPGEARHTSA